MPSRKRSKGQARKANAAAARGTAPSPIAKDGGSTDREQDCLERQQRQMALSQLISNLSISEEECYHGFAPPVPRIFAQWVKAFDSAMHAADQTNEANIVVALVISSQIAFDVDAPAWDDPSLMERLRSFLAFVGTEYLLKGVMGPAICYALMISMIENSEGCTTPIDEVSSLARDMLHDKEGEATRFYRKRIGCSCLKEKYAAVKTKPRMGACSYCHKEKRRSQLMLCQKCNFCQYCSKECQRLDWPIHKDACCSPPPDGVFIRGYVCKGGCELLKSSNTMNR